MKHDRSILFEERTKENCFFPKDAWILPTFLLHFICSWVWNSCASWVQARDSCHGVLGDLSHRASPPFLIWPKSLSLSVSLISPLLYSLSFSFLLSHLSFLSLFLSFWLCLPSFLPFPCSLYFFMLWPISKKRFITSVSCTMRFLVSLLQACMNH